MTNWKCWWAKTKNEDKSCFYWKRPRRKCQYWWTKVSLGCRQTQSMSWTTKTKFKQSCFFFVCCFSLKFKASYKSEAYSEGINVCTEMWWKKQLMIHGYFFKWSYCFLNKFYLVKFYIEKRDFVKHSRSFYQCKLEFYLQQRYHLMKVLHHFAGGSKMQTVLQVQFHMNYMF